MFVFHEGPIFYILHYFLKLLWICWFSQDFGYLDKNLTIWGQKQPFYASTQDSQGLVFSCHSNLLWQLEFDELGLKRAFYASTRDTQGLIFSCRSNLVWQLEFDNLGLKRAFYAST